MHIDRKIQLGELYKELRIARGLKQKDVARKGLSIAQLSKFENGQTMLSADKLLIAIESIHMTFEEFGHKSVSYTHLRAHETPAHLVCRLLKSLAIN